MAGIARPSDDILIASKKEMTDYILGSYDVSSNITISHGYPSNLFDGVTNTWDNGCYFYSQSHYFIITFNENVNIYRCGLGGVENYITPFIIYKLDEVNNSYIDITDSITQHLSKIDNTKWELYIENLPKGTYKFQRGIRGVRFDSEWFLEKTDMSSEIIKTKVKNIILNNKLFQEHCITSEEE